jgi:probable HAF family extracellular repeat protein
MLLPIARFTVRAPSVGVNGQPTRQHNFIGGKEGMSIFRQLRNLWIPWVMTIALFCFSNAVAQTSYKVIDQGALSNNNFSMVMGLNNQGWTENMDGVVNPPINSQLTTVANGRAVLNIHGLNIDLGTLGGPNSWNNYGGINDRGEVVGMAETAVPDPDGEDVCAFGTGLTCRPFLWRDGHMRALPILGGNNGEAAAINNHGQIAGFAETTVVDSGCPPFKTTLAVMWEDGKVHALPTVGSDPDGFAQGINNRGQAVGYSGTCTTALRAVVWENGIAIPLPDLGHQRSNIAFAINDRGQIVGQVRSPDGTTRVAALWQNGAVTNLGVLPGDFGAFASGINNRGQVVGSTNDVKFNWSRAFIWQDGVMTDLNTLFPADSNLFAIAASNINDRGQISGMGLVLSGPHAGDIHAFLATPVKERVGTSIADIAPIHPKSNLPEHACHQAMRRLGLGRVEQ